MAWGDYVPFDCLSACADLFGASATAMHFATSTCVTQYDLFYDKFVVARAHLLQLADKEFCALFDFLVIALFDFDNFTTYGKWMTFSQGAAAFLQAAGLDKTADDGKFAGFILSLLCLRLT